MLLIYSYLKPDCYSFPNCNALMNEKQKLGIINLIKNHFFFNFFNNVVLFKISKFELHISTNVVVVPLLT